MESHSSARATDENVTTTSAKEAQQRAAAASGIRTENPFAAAKQASDGEIEHFFPSDPPLGIPTDAESRFGPDMSAAVLKQLALESTAERAIGTGYVPLLPPGHVPKAVDLGPVRVATFRLSSTTVRASDGSIEQRKCSLAESDSGSVGSEGDALLQVLGVRGVAGAAADMDMGLDEPAGQQSSGNGSGSSGEGAS